MRGAVKVTLLLVVIAMAFFLGRHRQAIRESNEGRARIAAENDLDVSPPPPTPQTPIDRELSFASTPAA